MPQGRAERRLPDTFRAGTCVHDAALRKLVHRPSRVCGVPATRRARWLPTALLALLTAVALAGAEVPPEWSSTPLESCDREPPAVRPVASPPTDALFSRFRLVVTSEARVAGSSVRWEFTPRRGVTRAQLQLAGNLGPADGVALWLKNPEGHVLSVSVRLVGTANRVLTSRPRPVATAPRWTQYCFTPEDFVGIATPSSRPLEGRLELVIEGLQGGRDYRLYVDEVAVLHAPLPVVRVEEMQLGANTAAGGELAVSLNLSASAGLPRAASLELQLEKEGTLAAVAELAFQAGELDEHPRPVTVRLTVPQHIAGGEYRVRVGARGARLEGLAERSVNVIGSSNSLRAAVACTAQGGAFLAEGKALPVVGGWQTGALSCREASWVLVCLTADQTLGGPPLPFWQGRDSFDFSPVDRLLAQTLAANPGAYLVPVVSLAAPEWWKAQHPRELLVFGDGRTLLPATVTSGPRSEASWAGRTWRQDSETMLRRLVEHLEQGPLGPAILGYQLAAGEGGHWAYLGAGRGFMSDYSGPQQEAFREWLKRKYRDLKGLRVAWGQPAEPLATPEALKESRALTGWGQVRIPSPEARAHGSPSVVRDRKTGSETIVYGVLHDPAATQEVIDYQLFASDLVLETLRLAAQAVKKAAGGRKLVGASYGALFDLAATRDGLTNAGQLALGPLLEAEELDFISAAGAGGGAAEPPLLTTISHSLAEHGKLWVGLAPAGRGLAAALLPLCGRGVVAWEGLTPETMGAAARNLLSGGDRRSISEIAVVVDDISAAYLGGGGELAGPLLAGQRLGLAVLGAPADVWLLDDVLAGRTPRYKLYVFLNAFYLDANSRRQLLEQLNAEPCTVLWVYAAGALDQGLGARQMKDLTGMIIVQRPGKGALQVRVDAEPPYTYGATHALWPRFACVDDRADVRGRLVGTELGGLAVKPYGQIRSVWSAAPQLPGALLRAVAREAGVHLYADNGDAVYACGSLLGLRAAGEEHLVRLPQPADVYDLTTEKPLGKGLREFRPSLAPGKVGLYYLVPTTPAAATPAGPQGR